jgi:hypothetical protein
LRSFVDIQWLLFGKYWRLFGLEKRKYNKKLRFLDENEKLREEKIVHLEK